MIHSVFSVFHLGWLLVNIVLFRCCLELFVVFGKCDGYVLFTKENGVYSCTGYPRECPGGSEPLPVACTFGTAEGYPLCGEGICCGCKC